jgi:hypothetical protein
MDDEDGIFDNGYRVLLKDFIDYLHGEATTKFKLLAKELISPEEFEEVRITLENKTKEILQYRANLYMIDHEDL